MKDIMADLETFGVPNRLPQGITPVIASIGACRFDMTTGEIGSTFYRNVTRQSCEDVGMQTDEDTLAWWGKQTHAARKSLEVDRVPIHVACTAFRVWVKSMSKNQLLWGNGIGFDNMILREAFDLCDITYPIFFTKDMDVRTLVSLGKRLYGTDARKGEPLVGTHHNALDDAIFQANYCSRIFRRIKGHGEI